MSIFSASNLPGDYLLCRWWIFFQQPQTFVLAQWRGFLVLRKTWRALCRRRPHWWRRESGIRKSSRTYQNRCELGLQHRALSQKNRYLWTNQILSIIIAWAHNPLVGGSSPSGPIFINLWLPVTTNSYWPLLSFSSLTFSNRFYGPHFYVFPSTKEYHMRIAAKRQRCIVSVLKSFQEAFIRNPSAMPENGQSLKTIKAWN